MFFDTTIKMTSLFVLFASKEKKQKKKSKKDKKKKNKRKKVNKTKRGMRLKHCSIFSSIMSSSKDHG